MDACANNDKTIATVARAAVIYLVFQVQLAEHAILCVPIDAELNIAEPSLYCSTFESL